VRCRNGHGRVWRSGDSTLVTLRVSEGVYRWVVSSINQLNYSSQSQPASTLQLQAIRDYTLHLLYATSTPHSTQHASHQPIPSRSRLPQVHQLNNIHIIVVRSARIDSHIAVEPALSDICIASAVRIVNTIIRDGAEESGSESVNGSQTKKRYELHKKQQLHVLDMLGQKRNDIHPKA
jgi:hypothetical protein